MTVRRFIASPHQHKRRRTVTIRNVGSMTLIDERERLASAAAEMGKGVEPLDVAIGIIAQYRQSVAALRLERDEWRRKALSGGRR
jgi:hypothetical protein